MKTIFAALVFAAALPGCVTSGNQCSTSTCSSSGPNNGMTVKTCADATVGVGGASETGSITYGGTKCSWSGTNFASQEETCAMKEANWCNPMGLDQ